MTDHGLPNLEDESVSDSIVIPETYACMYCGETNIPAVEWLLHEKDTDHHLNAIVSRLENSIIVPKEGLLLLLYALQTHLRAEAMHQIKERFKGPDKILSMKYGVDGPE